MAVIGVVVVPLVVLLGLAGLAAEQPWVKGAIEVTGPTGAVRFAPTACRAGGTWPGGGFFGVVLTGGDVPATVVRVVRDAAAGDAVVLGTRPSAAVPWQEATLTPTTCSALTIDVQRSGRQARRYHGKADVDCRLADGRRALGVVTFGDCQ